MPDTPPALVATGIGVRFHLPHEPVTTLKETLVRLLRPLRRHEPFWALRGVSLALGRGDALAVLGRNGAGKTTLLRVLAGILRPTEGRVEVTGRALPLLDLTGGFLGELTAVDNAILAGACLGLRRREVAGLLPAILEFAELAAFGDVPIRHFSTGMLTRLGFALTAHLPADVLLIDEALAVGDAAFQARCLAHLDARLREGVPLVLVTHVADVARRLCPRAVVLEAGRPAFSGETGPALAALDALLTQPPPPPTPA